MGRGRGGEVKAVLLLLFKKMYKIPRITKLSASESRLIVLVDLKSTKFLSLPPPTIPHLKNKLIPFCASVAISCIILTQPSIRRKHRPNQIIADDVCFQFYLFFISWAPPSWRFR